MDDQLRNDLKRSHALINALAAATQGAYAFECSLGQFGAVGADDRAEQLARQIRQIESWWSQFKRRQPLLRDGKTSSSAARSAWAMLRDARARLRKLTQELRRPVQLESLAVDPEPLRIRTVAMCGSAYAREHLIRGLVCRGDVMDEPGRAEQYRSQLPACEQRVRQAHRVLERTCRYLSASSPREAAELLDATLVVPVEVAVRALELEYVESLAAGEFDYSAASIGSREQAGWEQLGLAPLRAGRWAAAEFSPAQAAQWIRAGVAGPLAAVEFQWRGIDSTVAGAWFAAGFDGREAATWMDAHVEIRAAAAFKARGARRPEQRSRVA